MSDSIQNLDPEQFYRTNDMAETTFLKLNGFTAQTIGWVGNTCYWVFDRSDALLIAVDEFMEGAALVEPKGYNKIFNQTKREFYDANPKEVAQSGKRRSA